MKLWTKVEEPLDVRVIIPYTKKNPLLQTVIDNLRIQFVQPELRLIKGKDDYWSIIREAWNDGREFFLVEHDVLPWVGAIPTLKACPERWCTLPVLCRGRFFFTTLGCVKFSEQLLKDFPRMLDDLPHDWNRLDVNTAQALGPEVGPHTHYPPAAHMNEIHWPDSISQRQWQKKVWQAETDIGGAEKLLKGMGITADGLDFDYVPDEPNKEE